MTNVNHTKYTALGVSKIQLSTKKHFTTAINLSYFNTALSNSAEPGNSNDLHMANSSTPLTRAFFVRSTRTPKENNPTKIGPVQFLSMVACNGKGSPFAVFHMSQFSSPLHVTAQTLESLAVALQALHMELSAMIYLFKAVSRSDLRNTRKHLSSFPRYTVRINANSIEQAIAKVAPFFVILEVCNA